MSKKEKIIGSVIIIVLVIIFIMVVVLTLIKSNKINKLEGSEIKKSYRLCQKAGETIRDIYEETIIEYIEVDDKKVISDHVTSKLKFLSEENYKQAKKSKIYGETAVYDDKTLTVEYNLGEENDYTKDEEGKEMNIKYNEFIKPLEEAGYVCD